MSSPAKKLQPVTKVGLGELAARWARAKSAEELARREAEDLRDQILEAGAEIGYADDHLIIGKTTRVEGSGSLGLVENKRLDRVLRELELLEGASSTVVDMTKVRALAQLHEKVAQVLEAISETRPRFEQAAKKK